MVSPVIHRASSEARKATTQPIVRLRKAFKPLHAERKLAARVSLDKLRPISFDDTGRDSVDADTAGAEERGEMLHESVDGSFGCCVRRDRTDNATRRQCPKMRNFSAA
jgi:hypothetical protein